VRRLARLVAAAALLWCTETQAHDFWIEPSSFTPPVGSELLVSLRVGERFKGDPVPRNPGRIEWLNAFGPTGVRPVEGAAGDDPAGSVRVETAGPLIIGYRSRASYLELDAAKFESYLAEEGLFRIIALRAQRGESGRPSREIYSRCAKSLVTAVTEPDQSDGSGGSAGRAAGPFKHDQLLGMPLELMSETDPSTLSGGGRLSIRLLYQGNGIEGVLVVAIPQDEPREALKATTDREGRVSFELELPGIWLAKAVHMIEAPDKRRADWESLWASLTFQIPAPLPAPYPPGS